MESAFNVYGIIGSSGGGGLGGDNSSRDGDYKFPPISYNSPYHTQCTQNFGFNLEMNNGLPKTLYIGNLHESVTEEFLTALFSQFGGIIKTKIIYEGDLDRYGFIEFDEHSVALQALETMNKRLLLNKELKINWAIQPGISQHKVDTSNNFHVFVGDLSSEIDENFLKQAFLQFGSVTEVKIIRDMHTMKTKGYGFVAFLKYEEAEQAIKQMHGQWLGHRKVRTNWAIRKHGFESQPASTFNFNDMPGYACYNTTKHILESQPTVFNPNMNNMTQTGECPSNMPAGYGYNAIRRYLSPTFNQQQSTSSLLLNNENLSNLPSSSFQSSQQQQLGNNNLPYLPSFQQLSLTQQSSFPFI